MAEQLFDRVRPSIAIVGFALVVLVLWSTISTIRQYNRLREFKGPRSAGFSKWWLVRTVAGGRAYLDFWDVTKRYGMLDAQFCWFATAFASPYAGPGC